MEHATPAAVPADADPALTSDAPETDRPSAALTHLAGLADSPDWRDRVRADSLLQKVRIKLPDQFPCIYETIDSPSRARAAHPRPHAWVVSPDIEMLEALLPDYQELWDCYTNQWGPGSRRTFVVGQLDNLSPRGVHLPGTTPEQVIGQTMQTHPAMYHLAPMRLRRMHPMHTRWNVRDAAGA